MKRFFLLTLASAALLGASAAPVKTYEVKSPDGRLALVLTAGERLSFTVARDGETLVAPSEMALTLSTGEVLGESPRVRSARRRAVTETIDAPLYRQSRFDAAYNELDLRLRGDYGILARAYDDGVCYRFYTERDGELTIVDETAQLNFEGDPSAYIPYSKTEIPMRTSFENTYEYAPLSKFRTQTVAFMPVLVDLGERGYVLYTESDVEAYPGVYLTYDKEAKGFAARFAECPTETSLTKRFQDVVERSADYIARVDGRRSYPWRIVAYAATATELPVNDMVWQTAEASRVADASWVRDGKIAWDWWNNWGVYGVDFKSGINTETYKYFIDFAAANGIEYVALDEGWGVRDGDVMHVVPEIDLPEIVSYAREKKVGIILWVVAKVLDDKLEEVVPLLFGTGRRGLEGRLHRPAGPGGRGACLPHRRRCGALPHDRGFPRRLQAHGVAAHLSQRRQLRRDLRAGTAQMDGQDGRRHAGLRLRPSPSSVRWPARSTTRRGRCATLRARISVQSTTIR